MTLLKNTYEKENLYWEWGLILERGNLIEHASRNFDFIPKVKFINLDNESIYNQTLVEKHNFNKIEKNEKLERLHYFANNLQKMTDFGLIHGDIKRSNVVFDGIKLNLIDWEPSFKLYYEALIKIVTAVRLTFTIFL